MTTRYKTDDSCVAAPSLRLSCLLCGGEDCVRLWEATDKKFHGQGRFRYVTCLACALVFLNPRPDDEELKQYYPDHVTTVTGNAAGSCRKQVRQWLKRVVAEEWYGYSAGQKRKDGLLRRAARKGMAYPLRPLLSQVPRHRPDGRVLDIGCGSGGYLAFLAGLGWTCYGIEPGANSRAYGREVLGLRIQEGPLDSCRFPDSFFDVVTMWHVIEHLCDPVNTLREVRRILKPDGLLMLRTPNVESWEARLFRDNWYGLDPPRHLFLTSPGTIRAMLERAGFQVTRLFYQYHPTDSSRSVLYLLDDGSSSCLRRLAERWIRYVEWGLTACTPFRRVLGKGGAMQVEARNTPL